MSDLSQTFTALSFTSAEIAVYLTLLEHGPLKVSPLARQAKLHRPRVYEAIEVLQEKGFVKKTGTGQATYAAAPPHQLLEYVEKLRQQAKQTLPKLQQLREAGTGGVSIDTYTGEAGLSACFLDVVNSLGKGDTFYRISSASDQQYVDSLVPKEYRAVRDQKGLERRVITSRYVGGQKRPRLERSMRFLEEKDEVFEHNVVQFIYSDKISLLDFNTLTATIIKNKAIADFQRALFKTLYKRLK